MVFPEPAKLRTGWGAQGENAIVHKKALGHVLGDLVPVLLYKIIVMLSESLLALHPAFSLPKSYRYHARLVVHKILCTLESPG